MTDIQTVRGPVPHDQLGVTLAHEHLITASPGLRQTFPWMFDDEADVARSAAELSEAKAAGIGTIVDVTTHDLGRAPHLVRQAAEHAGLNVVVATGIWLEIPRHLLVATADDFDQLFTHEIEVGLEGAGCRAGIIKVANSDPPGVGEVQEAILRGAARAAARTRVPITTHTGPYAIGRDQMRIFADEGVDPSLVAIGHSFTSNLPYLHEVLERGHYLSIDQFNARREYAGVIRAIAILCAEGYASRILLSHDHSPVHATLPSGRVNGSPPPTSPTPYTFIPRVVRPALERQGVSRADLDRMLVEAPATFLAGGRT